MNTKSVWRIEEMMERMVNELTGNGQGERNSELLDDAIQYTWSFRPNEWLKWEILGVHPTTQNSKTPETQLNLNFTPFVQIPTLSIKYQILPHPQKSEKKLQKWFLYLLPDSVKGAASINHQYPATEKKRKNPWPESNH